MKKGDIIEDIVVQTMAAEGKCVARINNLVIFLEGGAPGDTVDVMLTKIKSSFLEGRVTNIKPYPLTVRSLFAFISDFAVDVPGNIYNTKSNFNISSNKQLITWSGLVDLALPAIDPIVASAKTQILPKQAGLYFFCPTLADKRRINGKKSARTENGEMMMRLQNRHWVIIFRENTIWYLMLRYVTCNLIHQMAFV